jgi:hypothetical protein
MHVLASSYHSSVVGPRSRTGAQVSVTNEPRTQRKDHGAGVHYFREKPFGFLENSQFQMVTIFSLKF